MKKGLRSIILILAAAIMMMCSFCTITYAAPEIDDEITDTCKAWMLVDATSGSVIAKSDTYKDKIYPASTTKILTAIIALDKCELDEKVTVSAYATMLGSGSSKCDLVAGEELTVKDLLYGMMLVSGNDAALALAYHISGSIDDFAVLMNDKAKEIGMTNSHFVNPHGLDNENHYVTCEDMAKLTVYAMEYDELMEICAATTYTIPKTEKSAERLIHSTNKLIYTPDSDSVSYKYQYATGLKTGSTYSGGGCIVATAKKDEQRLIALVFGDPSDGGTNRWKLAKYLFEYGFNNFITISVGDRMKKLEIYADVQDASDPELSAKIKLDVDFPDNMVITLDNSTLGESPEFTYEIDSDTPIKTPFGKGDVAANVKYLYGGNVVYECKGYFSQSIESLAEAQGLEGIVTAIDTEQIAKEETYKDYSKLWWWLMIPIAGIIFILIRMNIKNRRPQRRYSARVTPARMPGYRRRHRRYMSVSPKKVRRRRSGASLRHTSVKRSSSRQTGRRRY